MDYKIDITYYQYLIGVILLIYNLILYVVWNIASSSLASKKYKAVCINVVLLIIAFIYLMSLALYARSLIGMPEYHKFLNSNFWHWRYTPVLLLFLTSSIRLTRWAVIIIRLKLINKNLNKYKKKR